MLDKEKRRTRRKGGRVGRSDKEEGGMRSKEGRGERRDDECENMKKLLKK